MLLFRFGNTFKRGWQRLSCFDLLRLHYSWIAGIAAAGSRDGAAGYLMSVVNCVTTASHEAVALQIVDLGDEADTDDWTLKERQILFKVRNTEIH